MADRNAAPRGEQVDPDDRATLTLLVDGPRGGRLERRLEEAAGAYEAGRLDEARIELAKIAAEVPDAPAVRELLGLVLYQLGRYEEAIGHLEAFRTRTRSLEQHPVLADCYRAVGKWSEAEALTDALAASEADHELKIEGRIVAAGALADQGRLVEAIDKVRSRRLLPKEPTEAHLRRAYVLADLHERAGDIARARQIFTQLDGRAPGFADTAGRITALE